MFYFEQTILLMYYYLKALSSLKALNILVVDNQVQNCRYC